VENREDKGHGTRGTEGRSVENREDKGNGTRRNEGRSVQGKEKKVKEEKRTKLSDIASVAEATVAPIILSTQNPECFSTTCNKHGTQQPTAIDTP
jgi:hypothetical protein